MKTETGAIVQEIIHYRERTQPFALKPDESFQISPFFIYPGPAAPPNIGQVPHT